MKAGPLEPAGGGPAGQHRAVGNTLLGLGALGAVMAVIAALLHLDLRLIDAQAMGVFSLVLAATGFWQRHRARQLGQAPRGPTGNDLRQGRVR